jgi:twinkle protein
MTTVSELDRVIVVTEGEFDAMAVHQATNLPAVSLPNGANSLPQATLSFFERFERIYLWLDADSVGQSAAEKFSQVSQIHLL